MVSLIFLKKHLLVFLLFVVAAVGFTFPLVTHFSTHIPSNRDFDGDAPMFLWNSWWFKYSLFTLHQNPYNATHLLYPQNPSLAFHTFAPVNNALTLPFAWFLSPQASFNSMYLLTLALNGFFAYLLAYKLMRHRMASVVAGMLFAFNPATMSWSLGHFNYVASWMIPLFVLCLFSIVERVKKMEFGSGASQHKNYYLPFVGAGIIGALQLWNDSTFAVYLIGAATLFFVMVGYIFRHTISWRKFVYGIAVTILVFFIVASPLLMMQIRAMRQEAYITTLSAGDIDAFSPDALKFFIPSPLNGILLPVEQAILHNVDIYKPERMYIESLYLGIAVLILACIGICKHKIEGQVQKSFFIVSAIVAGLLALGPTLHFAAKEVFVGRMPFRAVTILPFLNQLRVSSRVVVLTYLALSVLAAYGVVFLMKSRKGKMIVALLLCIAIIEYWPLPRQIREVHAPSPIVQLAQKGTTPIFIMPFGMTSGFRALGAHPSALQAHQIWHKRPIVGGTVSRIPDEFFSFYQQHDMAPLIDPESVNWELADWKKAVAALQSLHIETIVLYDTYFEKAALAKVLLELAGVAKLVDTGDGVHVFSVQPNSFKIAPIDGS